MQQLSIYDEAPPREYTKREKPLKVLELGLEIKVLENGDVYSFDKTNIRSNGRIDNRKGKKLKQKINKYGYKEITLSNGIKRKTILVHRLVASAFIENRDCKPTVNHKNGDKTDNNVNNLEWATYREQKEHAIKLGLAKNNLIALEESNNKKSIKIKYNGEIYNSIREAARINKVHQRVIKKEGVIICKELNN